MIDITTHPSHNLLWDHYCGPAKDRAAAIHYIRNEISTLRSLGAALNLTKNFSRLVKVDKLLEELSLFLYALQGIPYLNDGQEPPAYRYAEHRAATFWPDE